MVNFVAHRLLLLATLILSASASSVSKASDFGTTGLITVPAARQMQDGYLAATISSNSVVNIFNITYQATPWLETTFRYSVFNPYNRRRSIDDLRDRSYAAKIRIAQEGYVLPELAVGIRDILGTGTWSGEYLVATKQVGSAEISAGLGWGRFAARDGFNNPLGFLDARFNTRPNRRDTGGTLGGEVRGGSFFRGEVGFFGGFRYAVTPQWSIVVERNSDSYERERQFGSVVGNSQINVGLDWTPVQSISAAISYQQGQYWGVTLRSSGDFKGLAPRKYASISSSLDSAGKAEAPTFLNLNNWYDRLLFDAERSGLRIYSASYAPGSSEVSLEIANDRYAQVGDAINQALLLSDLHLPADFSHVSLLVNENELPATTVRYQRQKSIRGISEKSFKTRLERISVLPATQALRPQNQTDFGYPNLRVGADLAMRVQLMDPNEPLKHQLYVRGTIGLEINRKLNLWSSYTLDLNNDFNTKRPSDSVLPRGRSEINKYLTEGENGIDSFYLEYKDLIAKDFVLRGYGGVLEEMFGGAGGEVLWSPFSKRWALGMNLRV